MQNHQSCCLVIFVMKKVPMGGIYKGGHVISSLRSSRDRIPINKLQLTGKFFSFNFLILLADLELFLTVNL